MRLIIEHKKTKREINGAFSICIGKKELQFLKAIFDNNLESDFTYGWINIDEVIEQPKDSYFNVIRRQKQISDTEPVSWDISM